MKILLQFEKARNHSGAIDEIVENISNTFQVVEDSLDNYTALRFVTIIANAHIEVNSINITLRDIDKPCLFISIYKRDIYAIEITF